MKVVTMNKQISSSI